MPDSPTRATPSHRHDEVALGVDARDPADAAIGFAFEAALLRDVRLHAVHAWRLPSSDAELPFGVGRRTGVPGRTTRCSCSPTPCGRGARDTPKYGRSKTSCCSPRSMP
ncbi:hypothetical protein ACFVZA_33910 [Streptomyces bottropensis]|uniref:hypothetical protein n=1 Tax=Streptomyces bottropensis TaxID=42235 RepID=UPI0036816DCA